MNDELILQQTSASGRLLPSVFTQVLTRLAKPPSPRGTMHGQELRLAVHLSPDDPAAAAFLLDFVGQGKRVKGSAHGPSAALLSWAFHRLAASLKCTLLDASSGAEIEPRPDAHHDAAVVYLERYESGVRSARREKHDSDPNDFVAWLARDEHVALAGDTRAVSALASELPMDDAPALYELLLDSDAVDDVFISERELTSLLTRFRAWTTEAD